MFLYHFYIFDVNTKKLPNYYRKYIKKDFCNCKSLVRARFVNANLNTIVEKSFMNC